MWLYIGAIMTIWCLQLLAIKSGGSFLFKEEVVCSSKHLKSKKNLNGLNVEFEFLEDLVQLSRGVSGDRKLDKAYKYLRLICPRGWAAAERLISTWAFAPSPSWAAAGGQGFNSPQQKTVFSFLISFWWDVWAFLYFLSEWPGCSQVDTALGVNTWAPGERELSEMNCRGVSQRANSNSLYQIYFRGLIKCKRLGRGVVTWSMCWYNEQMYQSSVLM